MVEFLLGVLIALVIMLSLLNLAVYSRIARKEQERKAEDVVQAAMDEAAEEEARRSRSMNEGFENLMQYEVRLGRGKTTGGEP